MDVQSDCFFYCFFNNSELQISNFTIFTIQMHNGLQIKHLKLGANQFNSVFFRLLFFQAGHFIHGFMASLVEFVCRTPNSSFRQSCSFLRGLHQTTIWRSLQFNMKYLLRIICVKRLHLHVACSFY